MSDEILNFPEVASLFKVAEKTAYTMAQKAEIPAFQVRGQWRFKRQDIGRGIEKQGVRVGQSKRKRGVNIVRRGDDVKRRASVIRWDETQIDAADGEQWWKLNATHI